MIPVPRAELEALIGRLEAMGCLSCGGSNCVSQDRDSQFYGYVYGCERCKGKEDPFLTTLKGWLNVQKTEGE